MKLFRSRKVEKQTRSELQALQVRFRRKLEELAKAEEQTGPHLIADLYRRSKAEEEDA